MLNTVSDQPLDGIREVVISQQPVGLSTLSGVGARRRCRQPCETAANRHSDWAAYRTPLRLGLWCWLHQTQRGRQPSRSGDRLAPRGALVQARLSPELARDLDRVDAGRLNEYAAMTALPPAWKGPTGLVSSDPSAWDTTAVATAASANRAPHRRSSFARFHKAREHHKVRRRG